MYIFLHDDACVDMSTVHSIVSVIHDQCVKKGDHPDGRGS